MDKIKNEVSYLTLFSIHYDHILNNLNFIFPLLKGHNLTKKFIHYCVSKLRISISVTKQAKFNFTNMLNFLNANSLLWLIFKTYLL